MEQLTKLEAAEAPATVDTPAAPVESATPTPTAPVKVDETPTAPDPKPGEGTPATADPAKPVVEPSKYEKARARLEKTWENVNKEKTELQKQREEFARQQGEFESRRQAFETEQAKSTKPQHPPEAYDQFALKCVDDAEALEAQAEKLEADGKYGEADKAKADAAAKRKLSKDARAYAAEIRANPPKQPADPKAAEAKFQQEQKEWWGKAAVDFPNVAKKGSPEALALEALIKDPATRNDVLGSPKAMYFAARMVNAETAAARVPQLDKELGEARAKIKELEGQLSIPVEGDVRGAGGGAEKSFEEMTPDQQEAQLRREAEAIDRGR